MGKKLQRYISLVLISVMFFVAVFPSQAFATDNKPNSKFQYVKPPIFNPHTGETVKIVWNFQLPHKTRITVLNGVNELFDIINGDLFPGEYVANEVTWDGKDNNGNILPNGTYTIVIDPVKEDEWSGRFPSVTKVTIMDSAVEDIVISPNVNGNYFMVYGSAEENMTESVEVYITSKNKDKDGFNETHTAEIKPGMWSVDVWLPEYEEVQITALKTNKVPKEAKDEEGNPILDENGSPVIVYEKEEIELGPINVLKHTLRPYDKLPKMAAYYYGNENEHTRIIEDNDLIPPYVLGIGSNLLVFDPVKDGEPPISEFADLEKMDEKCGIIDLLSGDTIFSKDPVNLATGNFIYSYEDITIDGSFPISFNRFYNSRDEYYGDLGANWHHNWEYRLQDMGDGTVKIISYDGNRQTYTLMTNGKYESPTGIYTRLEKHRDQTYTLTMENKWEYDFNERGELVKITDTNGNSTKLRYEGMLLREIRNDSGYLLMQYYNDGRIREISDNTGRHIAYNYDGDDLVSYVDPEGNTIEYEYDSERRMTRIISPLKDGSVTNIYDNKGRVIEQTLADGNTMYFEYDEANRTTTLTERDGTETIYKYDEKFRITESIYPDGTIKVTFNEKGDKTSFTDKKGNTYEYEHDDYGNVTLAKDPLGNITRYTYDEFHNITSVKYSDGTIYEYIYDNKGNLTKSKDPMNRTTEIIYNNKGLPEKIIQPDQSFIRMEYDTKGNVKATVDPLGNKTEYEYDSLNRVNKVIDPLGNGTKFEYTDTGKIRKVTDALGNSGTFVYNKNGRLKEAWDQNGNITKYIYDEADQLKQIDMSTLFWTTFFRTIYLNSYEFTCNCKIAPLI
ncbi:DUF6531 domain-containing protein [Proteiniborus sp.]|uniref:DUF6531 domain-containing protein n=1 Tax=Proteiniborus sp. TaxID=2079015 RepID=UPI00331D8B8C